jgi:hypothetical protein
MVVDDFHNCRTSIRPNEADSKPIVDSNAALSLPIADKRLQTIPWRRL